MTNSNFIGKSKKKDSSQIVCYNYNKKGYFARDCTKTQKDPNTNISLGELRVNDWVYKRDYAKWFWNPKSYFIKIYFLHLIPGPVSRKFGYLSSD